MVSQAQASINFDVSIVIPVRNDADQIKATVGSIVTGNSVSIEFIFVDDASTDQTGEVLRSLLDRVVVGHLVSSENQVGAGVCRNLGMAKAQGDFLLFFDADDLMPAGSLDQLVRAATESQSDIVIGRYAYSASDPLKRGRMSLMDEAIWSYVMAHNGCKALKTDDIVALLEFTNFPWNKLIRRNFALDIGLKFSGTIVHNDIFTHWHLLMSASSVKAIDRNVCIHSRNPKRTRLTDISNERRLQLIDAFEEVESLFAKNLFWRNNYYSSFLRFKLRLFEWVAEIIEPSFREVLLCQFVSSLRHIQLNDHIRLAKNSPSIAAKLAKYKFGNLGEPETSQIRKSDLAVELHALDGCTRNNNPLSTPSRPAALAQSLVKIGVWATIVKILKSKRQLRRIKARRITNWPDEEIDALERKKTDPNSFDEADLVIRYEALYLKEERS